MATFLELAQGVARESGTTGTPPSSVIGQTGRLGKIVNWTAEAWLLVQNRHSNWRFLRKELPDTALTSSGTARYTPAAWNITDHAAWITDEHSVTVYKQSEGVADEGEIAFIDWQSWRMMYDRGVQNGNRPVHYTISPAGELCFGPTPDAIYVVRGEYRRAPQILSANEDVPICHERFHNIVVWRGVLLLGEHDEATVIAIASAAKKYAQYFNDLERDEGPRFGWGAEPLA